MRSTICRLLPVITVLVIALLLRPRLARATAPGPLDLDRLCAAHSTAAVVVDTAHRTLVLCANSAAVQSFRVALGVGGLGKRRAGDNRTPLGTYPLGAPRGSAQFGTFIPVGYPTPAQVRAGFTGHAVGIHGPLRAYVGAGSYNTASDWTAGCVAVGSDEEIGSIARWLRASGPVLVHIQ
jgi:hypothetical protein